VIQSIADDHPRAGRVEVDPAYEPETMAEADEYLSKLVRELCACVQEERSDRNASLCKAVRAYLETAYADDACCPAQVADHFHLSLGQLNRIYKQRFGVGLATALDEVRMAKAKALLTETAHSIKDIVAYVGYGDVNNFIRKFKKHEGMTPLVYRKKMAVSADIQAVEG
ncbi:MAG TPA: AraC family transcriptional regulator, partial [Clostridia bacterium]|nr:AraC family transcriptional regulator [Clostridia bacterium]